MKNKFSIIAAMAVITLVGFKEIDTKNFIADSTESEITWLAKKVTGSHTGDIKLKEGNLDFDKGELVGGLFVFDMASITCTDIENEKYNKNLVKHLKSEDFFNVIEHSTAEFTITETRASESEEGNYDITGDLTIKGITN